MGDLIIVLGLLTPIVVIILFIVLIERAHKHGVDASIDTKLGTLRVTRVDRTHLDERNQYAGALERYSDAAVGLVAVAQSADDDEAGYRWSQWAQYLAVNLASALQTSQAERYRVAIWMIGEDDTRFEMLAVAHFDAAEQELTGLSRTDSIGALAFGADEGECYVGDIATDQRYRSRSGRRKPYASILAIALGTRNDRWGVMTIDAKALNGFTEADKDIVRHYAKLASLGFSVWLVSGEGTGLQDDDAPVVTGPVPPEIGPGSEGEDTQS